MSTNTTPIPNLVDEREALWQRLMTEFDSATRAKIAADIFPSCFGYMMAHISPETDFFFQKVAVAMQKELAEQVKQNL